MRRDSRFEDNIVNKKEIRDKVNGSVNIRTWNVREK